MRSHYRTKARYGGFTLVELIVTVSVIATIAVLGVVYGNGYKASSNNAERLSDVDTLKLAAESYSRAKGDYPEPTGNRIYFDSNGAYEHSATGSYGVSGTATSDLFGSEFLAEVPKDPETGNFYGYGKRKDGVAAYDFATVDRRTDGYYAHVRGNYDGSALPSLVREYNGPGFVEDGKTSRLPYNPYEMKVTAKVASFSGAVKIVPSKSLTGELVEGDVLNVPAGGYAMLHVSDGTEARV
ncbi:MAG: type II secretion system protein [Patescibacteria group bacterium]